MAAVTTTVSLVGREAAAAAARLAAAATNVSLVSAPQMDHDPLADHQRRLAAWREARRHPPVYTVAPFDPLATLVELWARRLGGDVAVDLESVIGVTPPDPSPHYYVVSPRLAPPEVDWYHGLLAGLSVARVVPCDLEVGSLRRTLADLPTGRELPRLDQLAAEARNYVPLPDLTLPT